MACETQATPTPRKIVQIAMMPENDGYEAALLALCNDGSVWFAAQGDDWHALPAIPQGPVA